MSEPRNEEEGVLFGVSIPKGAIMSRDEIIRRYWLAVFQFQKVRL